jgi:predicted ester cyclase
VSTEENKKSFRRLIEEVFNKWDLSVLSEIVAPDFIEHGVRGQEVRGLESFKQMLAAARISFPNSNYVIEDMLAEEDMLAVRYSFTATHKGEYMGIAPTGKKISTTSAYFCRFENGKLVEAFPFVDRLVFYQQLGVASPVNNRK